MSHSLNDYEVVQNANKKLSSWRNMRGRKAKALRTLGAVAVSLSMMTAFGCSSNVATETATSGSAGEAPAAITAPTSTVYAMEYGDGSDIYDHDSVLVTDSSLIGEGAQFINGLDVENTYIYKGYAHGDNSHYSMYSLYTELITDSTGLLTGINLTSGVDTWSNKWGSVGAKPTIVGLVPEGVVFNSTETGDGSETKITFDLTVEDGTDAALAGHVVNQIMLYKVAEDGTTVGFDREGKGETVHYDFDAVIEVATIENPDADDEEGEEGSSRPAATNSTQQGASEVSGSEGAGESGRGDRGSGDSDRSSREGRESGETTESAEGGRGSEVTESTEGGRGGESAEEGYESSEGGHGRQQEPMPEPVGASFDADTNTLTIEDGAYNLVQVRYQFGTEVYFDFFVPVEGDTAAQEWVDTHVEETDMSATDGGEGTASTNRDKWTYAMLSIIGQRQLQSWGPTFEDLSLYTGGNDSEIGDIDTISGATKTSIPFQSALNQAIEAGYVTGVSDYVEVTVDGGDVANGGIDASAVPQDQTTVTVNDEGQYVLTMNFPAGVDESDSLEHAISVNTVEVYELGDEDMGALGVRNLGKGTAGVAPVASYADSSDEPANVSDEYVVYTSDWDYPYNATITVVDPDITHIVVVYTIGHENLGIAYDLAAMAQAGDVQAMITDAVAAGDADALAQAQEAYEALPNEVKGVVSNYNELLAAQEA